MVFQFSSIPMPIILFLFFILFLLVLIRATNITCKSKRSTSKLPPGPWKLPLVGNMHQLAVSSLVHRSLTNLAKTYGPLMHLQLGEISIAVVSSPEMAAEIMKTHDTVFASRPGLLATEILLYNSSDIGFSPYGGYWKQLRKICTMELLSPQRVQTFRGIREEEVLNFITSIASDAAIGPLNLSRRIFLLIYGITARAAFGKKSKHQDDYISLVAEALGPIGGFIIADLYPSVKCLQVVTGARKKLEKLHKRFDEVTQAILDEHKEEDEEGRRESPERESEENLIDVLLRIQKHGEFQFPLSDDNIKAVINDIFSAGSDTSSTTVEWAMSEIMKNPEVMQRAQDEVRAVFGTKGNVDESGLPELNYLKMVIKETLRLHPPAPLIPRESSKDCEINGYVIPAKTRVLVNAWAIGRDPINWIQPHKFNPDRFLNSGIGFQGSTTFNYIPFGGGRRICPGVAFAIPNLELPLAQLLYHFDWKLPGGLQAEELDMEEVFGLISRRRTDLCLTATPYHSSSIVIQACM